ncbi:MAG: RES family NAD+ phosphorylase [Phycisphaerales bacterium]|nr:RES family NAD+ phosphorylase [Phycisphaerales bacterium]
MQAPSKYREHPEYPRLLATMEQVLDRVRPWRGMVYRSALLQWADEQNMLNGLGSMKSGARFNAPGTFPALYTCTSPELVTIESLANQRRAGLPVYQSLPLIIRAIDAELGILHFTDEAVLSAFATSFDEFRREPWWLFRGRGVEATTQAIRRAAHALGVQAIQYPSAHTLEYGENIVIFLDNISRDQIKICE